MALKLKKDGRFIFLVILLLAGLAGVYFLHSYGGFVVYPRQSFIERSYTGSYLPGISDLYQIYYDYAQWFDFFLFLAIFVGLGKVVFEKHFKEGGKAIYIGLGVFLALALVLWEVRSGVVLLELFGPLALVFMLVLFLFIFYKYLSKHISAGGLTILCGGYALLYFIFFILANWLGWSNLGAWYYSSWLYYNVPFDFMPIAWLLFVFSIIGLIIGLIFWKAGK